jgi:hypothetical protein
MCTCYSAIRLYIKGILQLSTLMASLMINNLRVCCQKIKNLKPPINMARA